MRRNYILPRSVSASLLTRSFSMYFGLVLLGRWLKGGGGRNFQKCSATVLTIKTLSVELLAIRILVSCRIFRG